MAEYKLESETGELLGVIAVPAGVAEQLGRAYYARAVALPEYRAFIPADTPIPDTVTVTNIVISRGRYIRDAVRLEGISLEELEKLPGFWFSPSAALLRKCGWNGEV